MSEAQDILSRLRAYRATMDRSDIGRETGRLIVSALTELERLRAYELRLHQAVNANCTCGGKGTNDQNACPACRVWHRVNEKPKP